MNLTFTGTGTNDGPALQSILNTMGPNDVLTVCGNIQLSSPLNTWTYIGGVVESCCLLMTNGSIIGAPGHVFECTLPANCDALVYQPVANSLMIKITVQGLNMTGTARASLVFATCLNSNFQAPTIYNNQFYTNGPWAFHHANDLATNPNGGVFLANFINNQATSGTLWENTGDSNYAARNNLTGTTSSCAFDISQVPGASDFVIEHNSLTTSGGALLQRNGWNLKFRSNNCEPVGPNNYPANSNMIISVGAAIGTIIEYNTVYVISTSGGFDYLIGFQNSTGGKIAYNMLRGVEKPGGGAGIQPAAGIVCYNSAHVLVDMQTCATSITTPLYTTGSTVLYPSYAPSSASWVRA